MDIPKSCRTLEQRFEAFERQQMSLHHADVRSAAAPRSASERPSNSACSSNSARREHTPRPRMRNTAADFASLQEQAGRGATIFRYLASRLQLPEGRSFW